MDKISRQSGILISPERIKKNSKKFKKLKNWIYVQWITPTKKKYFVLIRPVIIYEIADGINLITLFPQDSLQERDNLELKVVNYILYGNGKPIRGISGTNIQLVRTCLVLNWDSHCYYSNKHETYACVFVHRSNRICNYWNNCWRLKWWICKHDHPIRRVSIFLNELFEDLWTEKKGGSVGRGL